MTLTVVDMHPVQYRGPLCQLLSRDEGLSLHVVYGTDLGAETYHDAEFGATFRSDMDLLEGYPHQALSSGTLDDLKGGGDPRCARSPARCGWPGPAPC